MKAEPEKAAVALLLWTPNASAKLPAKGAALRIAKALHMNGMLLKQEKPAAKADKIPEAADHHPHLNPN
jgi:hypothetical protein